MNTLSPRRNAPMNKAVWKVGLMGGGNLAEPAIKTKAKTRDRFLTKVRKWPGLCTLIRRKSKKLTFQRTTKLIYLVKKSNFGMIFYFFLLNISISLSFE